MSTRISTRDSSTSLQGSATANVSMGDKFDVLTGSISISGWFKLINASTNQNIFSKRQSATGTESGYGLMVLVTSGKLRTYFGDGTTGSDTTSIGTNSFADNKYHFYTYVIDRTLNLKKLYVDSVLLSSVDISTITQSQDNVNNFYIGATTSGASNNFTGRYDECRVHNYALSQSEVSNLYFNNVVPRTGLVGEWLFNEGSGTTALDTSGNGNNGTITGATYTTDVLFKPRVGSTNKTAVQPMNASLNFSAPTHKIDCGTDFIGTGDMTVGVWVNSRGSAGKILDNGTFVFGNANSPVNSFRLASDGATFSTSSTESRTRNKWNFITVTRTSAGVVNFRIGKTASGTANQSSGTPTVATTNPIIGNRNAGSDEALSQIKDLKVFNRILTTSEQDALMSGINPTDYSTSIVRDFSLNEGAGTTVYSKNNSALTGTITGATWSKEVPTLNRGQIGGNLVKNGDLSYVPVVNVATTTNNRFIDGTVGGSLTNIFGWRGYVSAVTGNVGIDTTTLGPTGKVSIKISALDATGTAFADIGPGIAATAPNGLVDAIKVLPSTSYTMTAWVKTVNVPTNGAFIQMTTYNGAGTRFDNSQSTVKLTGTNDWTKITSVLTTSASAGFMTVGLMKNVAGNISDVWFSDITLTPTVNTTRASV